MFYAVAAMTQTKSTPMQRDATQAYACAAHTDLHAHLTNYAQNMHGDVWDLGRLSQHLGGEAFTRLLEQIQHMWVMAC